MKKVTPPAHIEALHAYKPGKPIAEVMEEYGLTNVIKLASNENPLGPSPLALEAIRAVDIQMVVGGNDTETWEINNPGDSNWMDGVEKTGSTRIERLHTLERNFAANGIRVRFDTVPGVAHSGFGVRPAVDVFLAQALATFPAPPAA